MARSVGGQVQEAVSTTSTL